MMPGDSGLKATISAPDGAFRPPPELAEDYETPAPVRIQMPAPETMEVQLLEETDEAAPGVTPAMADLFAQQTLNGLEDALGVGELRGTVAGLRQAVSDLSARPAVPSALDRRLVALENARRTPATPADPRPWLGQRKLLLVAGGVGILIFFVLLAAAQLLGDGTLEIAVDGLTVLVGLGIVGNVGAKAANRVGVVHD